MLPKLFGALAPLLLLTLPLAADSLTVGLDEPVVSSPPGGIYQPALCQNADSLDSGFCVIFTGTITTGGDQDYFLNALYLTMDPSNPDGGVYVFDDTYQSALFGNAFFLNATSSAGLLGPDSGIDSYSGGLFEVDVEPGAPVGTYFGTATLEYTDETDCTDPSNPCLVPVSFEVEVAPEPGALILAVAGLAALAILRRRAAAKLTAGDW